MLIDLKNVVVSLEDGSSDNGAIDNVAGYPAGATTIVVDGFSSKIPVGSRLTIDGINGYTVVSTIETAQITTSITFTPGLRAAILDADVVLSGPRYMDIKVGEGNITYSEKKTREYKKDRGRLDSVRDGDEEPMDVTFQLMYTEITAADPLTDPPTVEDVLKHRPPAEDWVNPDTENCNSYSVNIVFMHTPVGCTGEKREKVVLPKFRYEQLDHDPKAGTISCQGKCNAVEAIVTRLDPLPEAA